MTMRERGFEFWIDRGGTFTDLVALCPDGSLESAKYLSDNPGRYEDAALHGIADILQRHGHTDLARAPVRAIKLGTTVATNALLERQGDPTALVITAGFADALRIGYQNRPDLFALNIELPEPLYCRVVEARERTAADGEVLCALDEQRLHSELGEVRAAGIDSVAIALLHGFAHPAHERRCARIARALGFGQVSVSHEVSSLVRLIARGDTTVADAYLTPPLRRYVDRVQRGVPENSGRRLLFMQSSGGLTDAASFSGYNSVLSGPAGGVVGMARTAASAGFHRVIGFDMGGTSTDVALYDGEYERSLDNRVAGVRLQTPMMNIHTVAAGGGSRLRYRDGRLQVGPESAGAQPGPACYGRGGPLAVTDINVLQGKLRPEYFPRIFGASGDQGLDVAASTASFEALAHEVSTASGRATSPHEVADGCLDIAVEKMALAIRQAALSRGIDVDDFALASFGGAAGQHACRVAAALGIRRVLVHPAAGVLSALGIGLAEQTALHLASVRRPLRPSLREELEAQFCALTEAATAELVHGGLSADGVRAERRARLRYAGSDTSIDVPGEPFEELAKRFTEAHRQRFGFAGEARDIVVESIMVECAGGAAPLPDGRPDELPLPRPEARHPVRLDGTWIDTPFYRRDALGRGATITGPAVIVEPDSTTVLENNWRARVLDDGQLLLEQGDDTPPSSAGNTARDPVRLELFNNLFMHIAEQMGVVLARTAHSVNIKERMDFSCALFDSAGRLIANAPHMPVHLGSMGESVRAVLDCGDELAPGEAFVVNDPYAGGTHLPDVTVVSPWFGGRDRPAFFLASRGHHADIGGITPGSMPAGSRHIDEEGVLIAPMRIVQGGRLLEELLRERLRNAPYPARNPDRNVSDIRAQLAANAFGAQLLERTIGEHGFDTALAYAGHVQDNAEQSVRAAIGRLRDGSFTCRLDGGEEVSVRVALEKDRATVDFSGTSTQSDGNFNAPLAVTRAAVLYVFRTLVDRPIPMNEGCLRPIDIVVPQGSMLRPEWPAAVAAGNVETSTCICDALYGALGILASSQGTMNNLTFGDGRLQYYETLCGGAGAGDGFHGADAVHTHMTNSRLTDPEIIENRFPVRLRRFALRQGSGGQGAWRGGDGIVREYEFLTDLQVTLLGNRRSVAPFGLVGGGSGAAGVNTLTRSSGEIEVLPATASTDVGAGDRLRIETPGGGGFGRQR